MLQCIRAILRKRMKPAANVLSLPVVLAQIIIDSMLELMMRLKTFLALDRLIGTLTADRTSMQAVRTHLTNSESEEQARSRVTLAVPYKCVHEHCVRH